MQKPLLTIAIPTYNRVETLRNILDQLKKEKNQEFIILVSDDASSDKTLNLVKEYQKSMGNLVYHKNNKNLGFSGNVCMLYELTKTKYIWFLCDDDSPLPGAIEGIITKIEQYKPTVALFNCTWINSYGQKITAGIKKDMLYTKIQELKNYQSLLRLTYLSIVVVEKRLSLVSIKKTNYKDNIFFQLTLGLYLLSETFRFVEVALPIVHRNVGYKYGEFFKFYLVDHLKAVFSIKHGFDNKKFVAWAKSELPNALLLYLSQKLGLFSYTDNPTDKTRKKIREYYGPFYALIISFFPYIYAIIPAVLLKIVYKITLIKIHGNEKGTHIYKENINRAFRDSRKTRFIQYR